MSQVVPTKPWSKQHKKVFKGKTLNLSNSFTEPLTSQELIQLALDRGDQEIVDAYAAHSLRYTPNGGSEDLRREIANLYGPKITADNVLVFTGAQVALQTASMALVGNGCHSIVFVPGYQSVVDLPRQVGSEVTRIRLFAHNNWKIPLEEVKAAIRGNTRYIVINQPYNPAGVLMGRAEQQRLKEIAETRGIHIMSDEVYRLLEHDPKDRLPAMADLYDKGMSCVTLSKPWGACGVTIGWIALQDMELREKLVDVQYFGTACPSRASEIQAIMVLRSSDTILERNMRIILRNKSLLERFIADYSDLFEWVRPNAGAIAFVRFKGPLTSMELGDELAAVGISIKPAYCFADALIASGCHDYDDFFRVGFGEEAMPKALAALARFVEGHVREWRQAKL